MKKAWISLTALTIVLMAIGFATAFVRRGLSTRKNPSVAEVFLARRMRRWAVPANFKSLRNPLPATEEILERGRNHWADHCASCHADSGSGETAIGMNLYPKAPDMRSPETQSSSDGELYYVIRNGVRMTDMPAWGKPEDGDHDRETWMLVRFIRHLPKVTADEERSMQMFNPKSAAEREEEQSEEDFLSGKSQKRSAP